MFQQPSRKLLSTPENPAPGTYVYRRVRIPNELQWKILVNGVLSLLCDGRNYEPTIDGVSVEDTTAVFREMFLDYSESEGSWVIGAILPFAGANVPANMLWCDGAAYNRVDYPHLYALLHPSLIVDDDHFKTPDLRNRFPIGWNGVSPGDNTGADGGEALHTLTVAEMPVHTHIQSSHNHDQQAHSHNSAPHTHALTDPQHSHGMNHGHAIQARSNSVAGATAELMRSNGTGTDADVNSGISTLNPTGSASTGISIGTGIATIDNTLAANLPATAVNQNAGSGHAHNNLPPYLVVRYAIIAN